MKKDKLSIEELFSKLKVYSEKDEHEGVLDCATRILAQNPSDTSAQQLRTTALIKLDKFDEAYKDFANDSTKQDLKIHFAYVLYKLGKFEELASLEGSENRAVVHVLAQAAYKREDFNAAGKIYDALATEGTNESEAFDIDVNKTAVSAQKSLNHEKTNIPQPTPQSYDQLFNTATAHIGQRRFSEALDLLKEAKLTCENTPGLSEAEIASEIAPILIQAALVHQLEGHETEARSTLENIDTNIDSAAKHVALNNLVLLEGSANNAYDVLSRLDAVGDPRALASSEIRAQTSVLGYNRLILQHSTGRDIKKPAKKFSSMHPEKQGPNALAVLSLANISGDEDLKTRTEKVKNYHRGSKSLASAFLLAQLYVDAKNFDAAAQTMEDIHAVLKSNKDPLAFAPGLISVLVSFYKLQHRDLAITEVLSDALPHWVESYGSNASLLQMAASTLAESQHKQQRKSAKEQFERLYKEDPSDVLNIAGVLATGVSTDVSLKRKLPSVESIVGDIDVKTVESNGVYPLMGKRKINTTTEKSSKKPRTNKSKPPKDFDPSKKPDPERWLPKRDRSTWKPKRKDKKGAKNSTQGGTADNTTESGITSAASSSTTVKSNNASKNKKKKKGKK